MRNIKTAVSPQGVAAMALRRAKIYQNMVTPQIAVFTKTTLEPPSLQ